MLPHGLVQGIFQRLTPHPPIPNPNTNPQPEKKNNENYGQSSVSQFALCEKNIKKQLLLS